VLAKVMDSYNFAVLICAYVCVNRHLLFNMHCMNIKVLRHVSVFLHQPQRAWKLCQLKVMNYCNDTILQYVVILSLR
jgi:hypothetical protein